METNRSLAPREPVRNALTSTNPMNGTQRDEPHVGILAQIFSPSAPMGIEHAAQSGWEQAAVGALCAVGGYLLAFWSMQGFVGLAVITLCVAFSTLVTAALCHYYDRVIRDQDPKACLAHRTPAAIGPGS